MLNKDIHKEIKGDNKIIAGLNIRELIATSIAFFLSLAVYFNLENIFKIEEIMFIVVFIAGVAWWFGWHRKSGLYGEQLLYLKIKNFINGNKGRIYKTENGYVLLIKKNESHKKITKKKNNRKKVKSKYKPFL